MLRSLYSGISGLRAHQQMMDVTGNNIANVNTTGFKSGQATFEDTLSQMMKSPGAPQTDVGGVNPAQVGLGVKLAGIQTNFTQGSAQSTGRSTDLMINGDGFFATRVGQETFYTRNGNFNFDNNGMLVNAEGAAVQGWTVGNDGKIATNGQASDINLPIGTLLKPKATTAAKISGNLPADTTDPTTALTPSITIYDEQGNARQLTASLTPSAGDTAPYTKWDVSITDGASGSTPVTATIDFAAQAASGTSPATQRGQKGVASPDPLTFNGVTMDLSGLSSFAGKATVAATEQDGNGAGSMQGFSVDVDGTLVGTFSNGQRKAIARIGMASFNNPPGLERVGNSMFRGTVNSGVPQLGVANSGGRGSLQGGTLEMSNVDLANEFTNLIIAQRGFQANSKVITASDELLGDLVNLKR
jgi:flagellar hook protein FlgE